MKKVSAVFVVCLFFASAVFAQDNMTAIPKRKIAKDMVSKAVQYIQDNGLEKAKTALSEKGEFFSGEFYVYVIKDDGTEIINGAFPELVGKNVMKLKDLDGEFITKEIMKISRGKGKGWVTYRWRDAVTRKKIDKKAYVQRVPDIGVIVCCGYALKNI